jgi:hypothetical protein
MNLSNLYMILAYVALCSYLLPISIGIKHFQKISTYSKTFWIGSIFSFFFFGLSFLLYFFKIYNTLYLTYLSTAVGVIVKLLFFRQITKNRIPKLVITYLALLVLFVDVTEAFYRKFSEMNNITAFFEYGWLIISTTYCLRNLLNINVKSSIRSQSLFWIFIGLLIYVFFSLIFDTFSNKLLKYSNQLFTIFALLIYISVVISNIFYAIALQKAKIFQAEQVSSI